MLGENFKEKAQEELLSALPQERSCSIAFLAAAAKVCGSIEMSKRRSNLVLNLDSYEKSLAVVDMLKKLYPADFEVNIGRRSAQNKCVNMYSVVFPAGFTNQALIDFNIMTGDDESLTGFESDVPSKFINNRSQASAFLKGLFFACGSVYVPSVGANENKVRYHLEFQLPDEFKAETVQHFLLSCDYATKINERGQTYLVYIKDKDEILKLLIELDLPECALQLRSIIDERETANSINRVSICETANLDKTFIAASRHIVAIEALKKRGEFDGLSSALKETAAARTEYPQLSLSELAENLKINKSCLNHRLRKLLELAENGESDD